MSKITMKLEDLKRNFDKLIKKKTHDFTRKPYHMNITILQILLVSVSSISTSQLILSGKSIHPFLG